MNTANEYMKQKAKQGEPDLVDQAEALTLDEVLHNLQTAVNHWDVVSLSDTVEDAIAKLDILVNGKPKKSVEQTILNFMLHARSQGLKYPKVQISVDPPITLVMNSRGQINITNGKRYGTPENQWFGKINNVRSCATLVAGRNWPTQLDGILAKFANDPAKHMGTLGILTDHCQFCGKQLSNEHSMFHGYGPTCAENYGLPWGDETATTKEDWANEL